MSQATCVEPNQTAALWSGFVPASTSATVGVPGLDGRSPLVLYKALQGSEVLMTEIERLSSTGGFCWSATTGEVTCTSEVYRIFELDTAVPVTLQLLSTKVLADDRPLFHDTIERARVNTGRYECQLRLGTETMKYLLLSARRSEGVMDQPLYVGAIQDVTLRRLSEEALGNVRRELARLARASSLGSLTASIAHEINQPLAGIMTNASTCLELLGSDSPDLDAARETARCTIRDSERACEVIARLRALFGKQAGKTESVDLNGAAREVIALLLSDLRGRRVAVHTELADDLPSITGDRVQLQQVILNLLLNATEAMSPIEDGPRQLLICTHFDAADHVRLSVQDTGVGFEPHDSQQLFEPFYTTKSGGMGIGLSVSRSIIESHDGRLWAQRNAGPGATFEFSIPVRGTQCSAHDRIAGPGSPRMRSAL